MKYPYFSLEEKIQILEEAVGKKFTPENLSAFKGLDMFESMMHTEKTAIHLESWDTIKEGLLERYNKKNDDQNNKKLKIRHKNKIEKNNNYVENEEYEC